MMRRLSENKIALLCFASLLVLAVVFMRERMIFLDTAYILFVLAKTGDFAIQNYRFAVAPIQAAPLAAIWAGLDIYWVMLAYSLAFVLFQAVIQGLIRFVLKDQDMARAHLMMQIFLVSGTFFWTPSEQFPGLGILMLYLAVVRNQHGILSKTFRYVLAALLLLSLVFVHPLLFIPLGFASVWFWIAEGEMKGRRARFWPLSLGLFLIVYVLKSIFLKHPYDAGAMSNLKHFAQCFPDYLHLHSNKQFLQALAGPFLPMLPAATAVLWVLLKQKRWKLTGWWLGSSAAYLLLVNVSYKDGADWFYLESHYQTLGLVTLIPLAFEVWPGIPQKWSGAMLVLLIGLRVAGIINAAEPFSRRLEWLGEHLSAREMEGKIMEHQAELPDDILMMSWAAPYEAWLWSAEAGKPFKHWVVTETPGELNWALGERQAVVTRWGVFPYREFPLSYFRFASDSSTYRLLP